MNWKASWFMETTKKICLNYGSFYVALQSVFWTMPHNIFFVNMRKFLWSFAKFLWNPINIFYVTHTNTKHFLRKKLFVGCILKKYFVPITISTKFISCTLKKQSTYLVQILISYYYFHIRPCLSNTLSTSSICNLNTKFLVW